MARRPWCSRLGRSNRYLGDALTEPGRTRWWILVHRTTIRHRKPRTGRIPVCGNQFFRFAESGAPLRAGIVDSEFEFAARLSSHHWNWTIQPKLGKGIDAMSDCVDILWWKSAGITAIVRECRRSLSLSVSHSCQEF